MDDNQKPREAVTQSPNGQPFTPTPLYSHQIEQASTKKQSKWRYFFIIIFIVLGTLQTYGVIWYLREKIWLVQQAEAGSSGTEFIGLLMYITLVPTIGIIAFINLIGLPIYMVKQKPRGIGLIFGILSLVFSLVIFLYVIYTGAFVYTLGLLLR